MRAATQTIDIRDWGLLVLLSLLWGGAFFFSGVAVRELPPLTTAFLRVAIAAAALLPVLYALGGRLPCRREAWVAFLGMGLLNNAIPFSLIFAGQTHIGVGLASIINATTPAFTIIVMALFREERLTRARAAGVLLGLLGVVVINGGGAVIGADATMLVRTVGVGLCLGGAVSYGFAALWGRRRLSTTSPLVSATGQLVCSCGLMAVIAAAVDAPWTLEPPSLAAAGSIVMLAIFGTALAYIVFFKILARSGASNVMLVTLMIPVTAVALGAAFLGETVAAADAVGAGFIALGLAAIDGRALAWLKRRWRRDTI